MTKPVLITLIVCCLAGIREAKAQYEIKGLDLDGDIASWYDQTLGIEEAAILEGSYYKMGNVNPDQNQFFNGIQWSKGNIYFSGQEYRGVDLLYNTYSDQILIKNKALHFSTLQPTLLNQTKIEKFFLHNREFVQLRDSIVPASGSGFYEQLFEGKQMKFFIKRIKNEYISDKIIYKEEDRSYLWYNGEYIKYAGNATIYKLFPENKKELKSFSKNLNTSLRRGGERDLVRLLSYCDELVSEK